MIKNERQYKITSALARQFEEALVEMRQRTPQKGVDPLAQQLEVEALKSQLADFRSDLEAYQALRSGKQNVSEVKSLADLPLSLIRARIASGMSQSWQGTGAQPASPVWALKVPIKFPTR